MFDVDQSDDVQAVVELARALGADLLAPAGRDAERSGSVPDALARTLFDTGLTVPVDEQYGGGGVPSVAAHLSAVEALAHGDPGLALAAMWSGAAALLIGRVGTEAQRAVLLAPMAASIPSATVALYEGFGRAPSEFATTITLASGAVTVRGRKEGVASAAGADPVLVVGRDGTDARVRIAVVRSGGVTAASVPGRLGLGAARLSRVDIDATVEADALLGGIDPDPAATDLALAHVRLLVGAALIGTAQRSVDYASRYAMERMAFGKPIAAFQGVSFLMADAALRVGAARLEVMDAAWRIDRGEAEGIEDITTRAVNYAGSVAMQATRDAIQVLGGHGFITDHPVELWYRSAAALAVLDCDPLASPFEPAL